MIKKSAILAASILIVGCTDSQPNSIPNIGDTGWEHTRTRADRFSLGVNPSDSDPAADYFIDGVHVTIAVGKDNKVSQVLICDSNFVSRDGISPGMTVDELESVKSSDGMDIPGWYYLIPLSSGWSAALPYNEERGSNDPPSGDEIVPCLVKT